MEILAHRGYWKHENEKNTEGALEKALCDGYGIETDLRDYNGKLVISHNIADETAQSLETLLDAYKRIGCRATLALNVKADGIQNLLVQLLEQYGISNYFLFDMSVPELIVNHSMKLKYYTRHSDVEHSCIMYEGADGVWLDSFYDDTWLSSEIVENHKAQGKKVCIVSPELHGREYLEAWNMIKQNKLHCSDLVQLCTDRPDEARRFFYEQD